MKKTLVFAAFVVALISFSSCEKDYTCECQQKVGGTVVNTVTNTMTGKKKEVKKACEDGSQSQTVGGVTNSTECAIK